MKIKRIVAASAAISMLTYIMGAAPSLAATAVSSESALASAITSGGDYRYRNMGALRGNEDGEQGPALPERNACQGTVMLVPCDGYNGNDKLHRQITLQ